MLLSCWCSICWGLDCWDVRCWGLSSCLGITNLGFRWCLDSCVLICWCRYCLITGFFRLLCRWIIGHCFILVFGGLWHCISRRGSLLNVFFLVRCTANFW